MAVAQGPFLAAVLLLVSPGLHCYSPPPACPEPCTCQRASLLNCSSSGLLLVPQGIQDSISELDLSHNLLDSVTLHRPHQNLRNVWLGNNSITRLSLCVERDLGGRYVRGRQLHRLRPRNRQACVSWAPTLQLLSVERNQLDQLPEGLGGSESLQILQLSFNRISTLQPGDFSHLRELIEIHLQHNLITSLYPQMFQDLAQLRVLDLSFNKLTSLHSLTYLSLHNIGADVRLAGNKWQCDCSMRSLRRQMAYVSSRGLQVWSVVCASPSIVSGRDLLHLEEDDLNCFSDEKGPELHQDLTVYSGSEILLSCSTQDSVLWTPSGQASVSQPQAGLLISDITESDTGLYVCVSEEHKVASVFNLQISKAGDARRKTRSLPRTGQQIIPQSTSNKTGQERNQGATQSDLALAVCLSVFITFLIAFILGVLARPCIDLLWRRVTSKKNSTETNSASSVEQRQYDNEAYFSGEEQGEMSTHRERRVTFSTIDIRDNNVQYYDTVASGDQESVNNDAVIEYDSAMAEKYTHTAGDSGSDNSLQQSCAEENQKVVRDLSGIKGASCTHKLEFEHIPDPVELEKRTSLSSSSDSSLSDKELDKDQMTQRSHSTPKTPQLAKHSVEQNADFLTGRTVEVPQISIEGSEIPGFSSEPFADWSPNTKDGKLSDPDLWQENEEQFEFSDSVRSSSVCGSFNDSKLIVAPATCSQKRGDLSSSSSYMSDNEPTEYTVNSDKEKEEDIKRNHNKHDHTNGCHDADGKLLIQGPGPSIPTVGYDTQRHAGRSRHSFSSHSSDGEDYTVKQETEKGKEKDRSICVSDKLSSRIVREDRNSRKKVEPMPRKWRVPSLGVTSYGKNTRAPPPPAAYLTSSSSESERELTDLKVQHSTGRVKDLGQVTPIKKHLDIRAPSPPNDSASSIESADEMMDQKQKQPGAHVARLQFQKSQTVGHGSDTPWPVLDLEHTTRIKKRLDIKAASQASDSPSSSDSENETMHSTERPVKVDTAEHAFQKSQPLNAWWPALDLDHIPTIKRRLDIKASSRDFSPLSPSSNSESSSSSDSEDESTGHIQKQKPVNSDVAGLPFPDSQTVRHDKETWWSAVDLDNITRIKRRLDIKALSPASDSSSSSDSEDETSNHITKQGHSAIYMARLPINVSQNASNDPQIQWPALNLENTTRNKRHLDIKAPSPNSDSSSSSDSEDESIGHIQKQKPVNSDVAGLPFPDSQTVRHDKETWWSAVDLDNITRIKRRLDIKALSPASDSSSCSDSEDETSNHITKQGHSAMYMARLPINVSQNASNDPQIQWPALNLENTTRIKRHLDIKAPSPNSDSSSSSDSEDETTGHIQKQKPVNSDVAGLPFPESQTVRRDKETRWPAVDLDNITRIKRRLDIKALSPASDSSSSSDSEDETSNQIKKQEQGELYIARLPVNASQNASNNLQTQWPALDLELTTRIKRRLDIKAPSPNSDSSSSSDSEDETTGHIQKQKPVNSDIAGLPFPESQTVRRDKETRWPVVDLDNITRIKRRLDIKALSPASDSSSSSDSEDETSNHIKKQGHSKIYMARFPINVSQNASNDPQIQWPALNLEHTTRIKRRLDIKAPSPNSDSSSSSDSEDESTGHIQRQKPVNSDIVGLPFPESQTVRHDKETRWPAVDLDNITRIKRRLDIKALSPASDSSSSSDSEDETSNQIKKQEQGELYIARLPVNASQNASNNLQTQWPALDLERTTRIKRRLDIKAPSPNSDSSSSSDSEDESTSHIQKQKPVNSNIAGLPFSESQTVRHDKETRWTAVDLDNITRIKRHLDIKALSPASDSSSSSDSEDEKSSYIEKQEQGAVNMEWPPVNISQNANDPQTQWPALDLEHTPCIRTRLDIKAPSPNSDSSSSVDSENETGHKKKWRLAKLDIAGLPFQEPQVVSHDPDTKWPAVDLERTVRIKKRLDIKAPSPPSESSSSSDSDDETPYRTMERLELVETGGLFQESQTVSHDQETQWPTVDLGNIAHIKRRLDIKAPSPHPDSLLSCGNTNHTVAVKIDEVPKISPRYSSSSSDNEEKGIDDVRLPPATVEANPNSRWPQLGLSSASRVKRHLDIRIRSPVPKSSPSSNDNDSGRTDLPVKVDKGGTDVEINSYQLGTKFYDMKNLDIKATSQQADSCSSSSDDESRISSYTVKHERDKADEGTTTHEQQAKLHELSLGIPHISRRLDIKAPSPKPDSVLTSVSPGSQQSESNSSSSDSDDKGRDHAKVELGVVAISNPTEKQFIRSPKTQMMHFSGNQKTDHNIELQKYTVIKDYAEAKTTSDNINTIPEIDPELESRWAKMNLGISRFRKRLEITSHVHEPPNLPSSHPPDSSVLTRGEKGTESNSSTTRQKRRGVGLQGIIHSETSLTPENKSVDVSLQMKSVYEEKLRKDYSLPKTEENSNPDTMLTDFGTHHFRRHRRHLDINMTEKAPAVAPLQQLPGSSSSSENENASSVSVAKPLSIKLDQSHTHTDKVQKVELKSQTSKVGEESGSVLPHLSLTNNPYIRAPLQSEGSFISNKENEMTDHSIPDLSLGIPHLKKRLNFKVPSPELSNSDSSCSETENEVIGNTTKHSTHGSEMSGMTDHDSSITYKRLIFKASSPLNSSFSHSGSTVDHTDQRNAGAEIAVSQEGPLHSVGGSEASLAPKRVPSVGFDVAINKRIEQSRYTTDVDLAPEIRWTGVGRQLSDLSISSTRRHMNIGLSIPQQATTVVPTPSETPNYSSSKSDNKIKQDTGKADGTLMQKYSSPGASTFLLATGRAFDKFDKSSGSTNENWVAVYEEGRQRKGLSALRAMSSERRRWDTQAENSDRGEGEEDIKPLAKQAPAQLHLSSTSADEQRATDLYDIPRYRRHDIEDTECPHEAPPPIPASPPPDEVAVLTWRPPQSSKKQGMEGTRYHLQQNRNTKESDPSSVTSQMSKFDFSNVNISHV